MRVWKEIKAADGLQTKKESLKRDERETEQKNQREFREKIGGGQGERAEDQQSQTN